MRLPENVRPEFYRLFNSTRKKLVAEKLPSLSAEAEILSENYQKSEKEVINLLGLEEITMATTIHTFLHSPMDAVIRALFNPLFDLLKGRIDIESLEQNSPRSISLLSQMYYQRGYEKWVVLSLVKLLAVDRLLQASPRRFSTASEAATMIATRPEEPVPDYAESKQLLFKEPEPATLTLPDFIAHSQEVKRFIAVRSEFGKAMGINSEKSRKRHWLPVGSMVGDILPGLILLYTADKTDEISLVADADQLCQPDVVIKCQTQTGWYDKGGLTKAKRQHESLKPALGTFIVSRETVPEQAANEIGEGINILRVGLGQDELRPIVNKLGRQ